MAGFTMWLVWPDKPDNAPESGPVRLSAKTREEALGETSLVLERLASERRPVAYRVYEDTTGNLVGEWAAGSPLTPASALPAGRNPGT